MAKQKPQTNMKLNKDLQSDEHDVRQSTSMATGELLTGILQCTTGHLMNNPNFKNLRLREEVLEASGILVPFEFLSSLHKKSLPSTHDRLQVRA